MIGVAVAVAVVAASRSRRVCLEETTDHSLLWPPSSWTGAAAAAASFATPSSQSGSRRSNLQSLSPKVPQWRAHVARAYGGERVLAAQMHVWMDRFECRTELRNQNPNARHCVTTPTKCATTTHGRIKNPIARYRIKSETSELPEKETRVLFAH